MKKLIPFLFLSSLCFGAGDITFHQGSGGGNITIQQQGGGGSGTVTQVNSGSGIVGGPITTSGTLSLDPSSTDFIHLQDTLQSGATFYVSSGTIAGNLWVNKVFNIQNIPDTTNSSKFNFDGSSASPLLVLDHVSGASATESIIEFRQNGNRLGNFRMFNGSSINSTGFTIGLSSTALGGENPALTRLQMVRSGRILFYKLDGSSVMVEFDPINNSSFTIPIYASTITANNSLYIPNSAAPVMSTGTIGIDTSFDQLIYMSTPGITRVLFPRTTTGIYIASMTATMTSTNTLVTMFRPLTNVTVKDVWCSYEGTGTVVGQFQLQTGGGTALTYTTPVCVPPTSSAAISSVTANGALTTGQSLMLRLTNSPTPSGDNYQVWIDYTWDQR